MTLIYGVGINDADYPLRKTKKVNGKTIQFWKCPFYEKWFSMLSRCYSEATQLRQPTYTGCEVCEDWLIFSNFKAWMEMQDWEGNQLDKDLLIEGNKVYSPDTCVFVTQELNKFLCSRDNNRGNYMKGVSYNVSGKRKRRYIASCSDPFTESKSGYIGCYYSELEAHLAWKTKKYEILIKLRENGKVDDDRVYESLLQRFKP